MFFRGSARFPWGRISSWLAAVAVTLPARAAVVINELHVDPYPKTSFVEFIELHNTGAESVDLTGWSFSDGVQYTFPAGATLPAGGYAVAAGDPAAVEALFGISGAYGPWTGSLSNDGETLVLQNASGGTEDTVSYRIGYPWPTVGDAPSYSLELLHPDLDNDLGGHWRSSVGSALVSGTLLPSGAAGWTYAKGTAEPSSPRALWRDPEFDDSAWLSATLPIGYGESGLATTLSDMRYNYSTVYLRRSFEVSDASQVTQMQARVRYDDGFNLWINGIHVLSSNVSGEDLAYTALAIENREDSNTLSFVLPDPGGYLVNGTNVIAVQLLNQRLFSGDAYLNIGLDISAGAEAGPTPGRQNSVYTSQFPPAVRQVSHAPKQPAAGEAVTISAKATAGAGIASMMLEYQIVEPGAYIRLTDDAYSDSANWTSMAMLDDGTGGDLTAGDDIFTARIPESVQTHRRLVRYRILATGGNGIAVTAPRSDDPVPNFAYFVYNGVPDWQGALMPGTTETLTFPAAALTNIPVYQLIANNSDVINCQYNTAYNDDVYRWLGTFVHDGEVYDHIRYRIRGSASTYATGKNKWKFKFPTGHAFDARNEAGESYGYRWENITLSALMCPWWANDASTAGTILNETAGMELYRLAGVPAIRSHFFHYRIIDDALEASASSQYEGDFWGLYLAIEETEADYLKANALPDGNLYNVNGSVAASVKRNQGPTSVQDFSDLSAEMSFTTGHHKPSPYQPYDYWTRNIALDNYYRFNTINLLANNTDMYLSGTKIERNLVYYRNPDTGLWWTLPWDLDLTFESAPHLGYADTSWEHFWYVLTYPEARRDYENVVREISDLLIRNGDAVKVIESAAARVCRFEGGLPVDLNAWPQANQAMWDYHPRAVKKGIFYKNMGSSVTHFTAYFNYMKNFVTPAGYGGGRVEAKLTLTGVPDTPAVTYLGEGGYPTDDLRFRVSDFNDTDGGSFAALQWRIAEITPTDAPGYPAVEGGIRYEIHPAWTQESGAFAPDIQIPYEVAQTGRTYRVRARMKDDTGHWSRWSDPVEFVPTAPMSYDPASAANLQLTEIHYNPLDDLPLDFIELRNVSGGPINLAGAQFDAGITFAFGDWTLQPGERAVVVQNPAAFEAYYGAGGPVAGVFSGNLSGSGEQVRLVDAFGAVIFDVTYDDAGAWPGRADGRGSSIELTNPAYPNDGASWRNSSEVGGSPGWAGAGPRGDLVINEVLAHTDPPQVDSIELYNTTDAAIDIGGWYLSDPVGGSTVSAGYRLFRVPDGTIVPARGYRVFDEFDFNDPASPTAFALSEYGEDIYVLEADATGRLVSFVDSESFGATPRGAPLGRWPNGGGTRLYPLSALTLNAANAPPAVPPVVLSEIHYNPGADVFEFLELYNRTPDPVVISRWTLSGITYVFPEPTLLPGHSTVVLVGFDPVADPASLAAFQAAYGNITPVGPWTGALDNSGEAVTLRSSGEFDPDLNDYPQYEQERVKYSPDAPWPTAANGTGRSLQRVDPDAWGDDPANWTALWPSAGSVVADPRRAAWYEAHFSRAELRDPDLSGGGADADGDTLTNDEEYAADTNPRNDASYLRLDIFRKDGGGISVGFFTSSKRDYLIERTDVLAPLPNWTPAQTAFGGTGGWMEWDEMDPAAVQRFYRLKAEVETP